MAAAHGQQLGHALNVATAALEHLVGMLARPHADSDAAIVHVIGAVVRLGGGLREQGPSQRPHPASRLRLLRR